MLKNKKWYANLGDCFNINSTISIYTILYYLVNETIQHKLLLIKKSTSEEYT